MLESQLRKLALSKSATLNAREAEVSKLRRGISEIDYKLVLVEVANAKEVKRIYAEKLAAAKREAELKAKKQAEAEGAAENARIQAEVAAAEQAATRARIQADIVATQAAEARAKAEAEATRAEEEASRAEEDELVEAVLKAVSKTDRGVKATPEVRAKTFRYFFHANGRGRARGAFCLSLTFVCALF